MQTNEKLTRHPSAKLPFLSEKRRRTASDEELVHYYQQVTDYYINLPFDKAENAKQERYYQMVAGFSRILNALKKTKVIYSSDLPKQQGLIYVSNHIGSYDQFLLASALGNRPLHYLVKDKVTTWPIRWNLIYKPTGVVIVDQKSISSWKHAKEQLVQYLYQGYNVFIFPEGTRRGEDNLGEFSAGIAQVVQESGKSIVTMAIKNSSRLFSRKAPIVCVGKTLSFEPRDGIRFITKKLQDTVYANYEKIVDYETSPREHITV